jgi:hypothetical protein
MGYLYFFLQSEPPSPRSPTSGTALEAAVNRVTNAASLGTLGPEDAAATSGNFFEALTSSEFYKNTKVMIHSLMLI